MENGWRYGFYAAGALSAISGVIIWIFLNDPGRGASDMGIVEAEESRKEEYGLVNFEEVKELFKVRTFVLMLGQRVLSGHLLMLSMGVVFMVDALGFDLPTANLLMMPLFLGMLTGMFVFGFIADWIHRIAPTYGRIFTIQGIQFIYAVLALVMLTAKFDNTMLYGAIFFFMGFFGSANMGVNRPIVASVVKPELRGTAFALFVSVFEAIAWAIYNIAAGQIGERIGLKPVFMVVLVILMLVNTAFITLLYKPYAKDVKALEDEIAARKAAMMKEGASI
jgi:predicted MFS family arabinose efflux permease